MILRLRFPVVRTEKSIKSLRAAATADYLAYSRQECRSIITSANPVGAAIDDGF